MTTTPKRTKNAQELFDWLHTTANKEDGGILGGIGWLSIDQMDGELLVLITSHPNCTSSDFAIAIGMATKFPDSVLCDVITSTFKNKKRFTAQAWKNVSEWALAKENYGKFFSNMSSILRDNTFLTQENYLWLFRYAVIGSLCTPGVNEQAAPKEYVEYLVAILDTQTNPIEVLFSDLFAEADYLQKNDLLATIRGGTVFTAINKSKNSHKILSLLHSLTKNEIYLPKITKDIFLW